MIRKSPVSEAYAEVEEVLQSASALLSARSCRS